MLNLFQIYTSIVLIYKYVRVLEWFFVIDILERFFLKEKD